MAENENGNELETLEKGNIYFFYRPRVEEEDPEGKSDVQRFYMVLNPEDPKERFRLAIIGRKKLPKPERAGKARDWGFVDMVRKDPKSIREALSEENYRTKTRGERHNPAARPCGEGVYRILRHEDHTHLVYLLELPKSEDAVQDELGIEEEASYIISVKNPERGGPRAAGLKEERQAEYPKTLQEIFRDRKFADADPPDFLNHEGTEFLLIGASGDPKEELGITLNAEKESKHSADVFKQMGIDKSERPVKPLFEGEWA
ncbi:MAG: hypothetical protein ACOC0H_00255 [Thermodesulfobacteriota bacterium]